MTSLSASDVIADRPLSRTWSFRNAMGYLPRSRRGHGVMVGAGAMGRRRVSVQGWLEQGSAGRPCSRDADEQLRREVHDAVGDLRLVVVGRILHALRVAIRR